MAISHPRLRKLMQKHHHFLFKLYKQKRGRNNRTTLQNASPQQIWLTIRLLFCIAVGHIPLTYNNYERLVKSKRKNNLRNLKNEIVQLRKADSN